MPPEPTNSSNEIYAIFSGEINAAVVQRFLTNITLATQNDIQKVHLLIHSEGGTIVDGIFLHNLLKGCGIEIVTYNCGSVSSIAVLPYLAGSTRVASDSAAFLIHKSSQTFSGPVTADTIDIAASEVKNNDAKIERILRAHLTLSEERWSIHSKRNLVINAQEALEANLIHEIKEWCVAPGNRVYLI